MVDRSETRDTWLWVIVWLEVAVPLKIEAVYAPNPIQKSTGVFKHLTMAGTRPLLALTYIDENIPLFLPGVKDYSPFEAGDLLDWDLLPPQVIASLSRTDADAFHGHHCPMSDTELEMNIATSLAHIRAYNHEAQIKSASS